MDSDRKRCLKLGLIKTRERFTRREWLKLRESIPVAIVFHSVESIEISGKGSLVAYVDDIVALRQRLTAIAEFNQRRSVVVGLSPCGRDALGAFSLGRDGDRAYLEVLAMEYQRGRHFLQLDVNLCAALEGFLRRIDIEFEAVARGNNLVGEPHDIFRYLWCRSRKCFLKGSSASS